MDWARSLRIARAFIDEAVESIYEESERVKAGGDLENAREIAELAIETAKLADHTQDLRQQTEEAMTNHHDTASSRWLEHSGRSNQP